MNTVTFHTKHLFLRRWQESDLQGLFKCLSNQSIASPAGVQTFKTIEDAREHLKLLMSGETRFAIFLENTSQLIGYIGMRETDMNVDCTLPGDLELGFWIDTPFQGKGYMYEAVEVIKQYGFEVLNCPAIWAGYMDGNEISKHCLENYGFEYHHTEENRFMRTFKVVRTEHFMCLTKQAWLANKNK